MSAEAPALDPRETLDAMLGLLDIHCEVKEFPQEDGTLTLQIYTAEKDRLIGHHGETLDDLGLLLNRVLTGKHKDARKVHVDVEHWREMRDDQLVQKVRQIAELVRKGGRSFQLEPMNAYERRIVHHAFENDPEITTWSPPDDARLKRVTLKRRPPQA
jgi:spoIIIJ-associated protein